MSYWIWLLHTHSASCQSICKSLAGLPFLLTLPLSLIHISTDDISLYLAVANPEEASDIKVEKENKKVETYSVQPKKNKVDGETTYQYGIGMQQEVETVSYTHLICINYLKL